MSNGQTPTASLSEFAIVVNPQDNVAVVKKATAPGLELVLPDKSVVEIRSEIPPGHRFATREIPAGEFVLQYGQPIGTSMGIRPGDWIAHENMTDDVPVVRDLPKDLHTPPPNYLAESERATFMGFRRADGRVGTRNFVLIVPTSMCASHEATQIAIIAEYTLWTRQQFPNVDGVVAIPH